MSSEAPLWDEHEERLVRFLLGRLPAAEQEELENRALTEDGFLDEVLATADELIHAYLDAGLSAEDRERFESHFLASPMRRQRFELLRDIGAAVKGKPAATPRSAPSVWMWAVAAAILIVAGLVALRLSTTPVPDRRIAQETPTPPPTPTADPNPVVRLPGTASGTAEIPVSAETRTVRIEVPIEDDRYPTFDATLRTADGTKAWESTGLVPPGPGLALVLMVPAEILLAEDYVLQVQGEKLRDAPRQKRLTLEYKLKIARAR